jgi:aldehyde dehydrogenase (NAD+)
MHLLRTFSVTTRSSGGLSFTASRTTLSTVSNATFSATMRNMSDLTIELTAPNGKKYVQPTGLFINNEWVPGSKGNRIPSINPSDESEIASVHAAEPEDVDKAVAAARAAFKSGSPWREMSPTERGGLMYKLSQLVEENKELLATIETWDNGKPYQVALNEDLAEVAGCIKYYAGWADKIHGQVIDTSTAKLAYTIREPIGVCGQIIRKFLLSCRTGSEDVWG